MKTLFKWVGGKTKRLPDIQKRMPSTHVSFREAFCGGAATYLHFLPHNAWLNDADPNVVNVFACCKERKAAQTLYDELRANNVVPLRDLDEQKEGIEKLHSFSFDDAPDVQQAIIFFRLVFWGPLANPYKTGIMDYQKSNPRKQRSFKSIEVAKRIAQLHKVMNKGRTVITCGDFLPLVEEEGDDVFLFLDPPYVTSKERDRTNKHYKDADPLSINNRLAVALKKTKHKFLLTVEDTPEYNFRKKYSWALIDEVEGSYGQRTKTKKDVVELFIRNYD